MGQGWRSGVGLPASLCRRPSPVWRVARLAVGRLAVALGAFFHKVCHCFLSYIAVCTYMLPEEQVRGGWPWLLGCKLSREQSLGLSLPLEMHHAR